MTCPHCATPVPESARFCPGCGASQSSASQMATAAAPPPSPASYRIGRLDASSSGAAAFSAGQVLNGRYRVIGLLGRGGMGEVYRVDDLRLGQPVSLKFLPRRLTDTPGALERFNAEVRNARQVSHPNVCRVYDIGDVDGQSFLTMEFVDGEDLATLLRRIGRLPTAKAHEVARQLCAGLAAAHDKGVLHRDLKPSNVMIDGDGRVRITDFGLAVRAGEAAAGDFAGTPAYMSPEQFEGKPVTERSDLYSLGLILYEIHTGRRPFEAASIGEWRSRHTGSEPTRPSQDGDPLDETTERAILRCLEKDPARRPTSALQLAAALPGGDPVAAALAAGETPSPEMVAASGGEGALSPRAATVLLVGFVAALAGILAVAPFSADFALAPLQRSASSLRERAHQVLARFGLDRGAIDSADWFERDYDPMIYYAKHMPSTGWRKAYRAIGAPVTYHYRQSPDWLGIHDWRGMVSTLFPPPVLAGMTSVTLSGEGSLRSLLTLPPDYDSTAARAAPAPDWPGLFQEARLDITQFKAVEPRWQLQRPFDTRAEWVGPAPWGAGTELRVTAGSYQGIPTYFAVLGPWSKPATSLLPNWSRSVWIITNIVFGLALALLVACVYLAWRNVRLGRGDRRGAARLGLFMFGCRFMLWAIGTHYFPDFTPMIWNILTNGIGSALVTAVFSASVYLAVEPYVRRRMPELLIGWQRLFEGRVADARVGREILMGAAGGACVALLAHVGAAMPAWVPIANETTIPLFIELLYGDARGWAMLFNVLGGAVWFGLLVIGLLFLLRVVLRSTRAAFVGATLLTVVLFLGGENFMAELPGTVVMAIIAMLCLARGGLLALTVMFAFRQAIGQMPLPLGNGAPYTTNSVVVLAVAVLVALYAFRRSLGTRLSLGRGLAEELG